jgi:hypothetical protein
LQTSQPTKPNRFGEGPKELGAHRNGVVELHALAAFTTAMFSFLFFLFFKKFFCSFFLSFFFSSIYFITNNH